MPFDKVNKQIGWLVEDTNQALKAVAEKDGKDPERDGRWRGSRFDFRAKIVRQVKACADKQLVAALLRKAEFDTFLDLRVDTVRGFRNFGSIEEP